MMFLLKNHEKATKTWRETVGISALEKREAREEVIKTYRNPSRRTASEVQPQIIMTAAEARSKR
jgi:hypothetical protein